MTPFPSSAIATISSSAGEWPRRMSPPSLSPVGGSSATAPSSSAASVLEPAEPRRRVAEQPGLARREERRERGQRDERAGERAQVAGVSLSEHEPRHEPLGVGHRPERRGEILARHRGRLELGDCVEPGADRGEVGERVPEPAREAACARAR